MSSFNTFKYCEQKEVIYNLYKLKPFNILFWIFFNLKQMVLKIPVFTAKA